MAVGGMTGSTDLTQVPRLTFFTVIRFTCTYLTLLIASVRIHTVHRWNLRVYIYSTIKTFEF